ncbi:hypothetical protein CRG98_018282 [Punica granatum]|uniref:Uncharacterized protein n=1 Tax=Punica granatum TaxID=22663 RepID=A0A2I0JYA8_PUNGR|nr:hypothetical protein CRG98_018282 [Punica granatum]
MATNMAELLAVFRGPNRASSSSTPPPGQGPTVDPTPQAPPPINTTFHEPGTPTHAAQFASPTHFFPDADVEQERRLKRMEETTRALQANPLPDHRPSSGPSINMIAVCVSGRDEDAQDNPLPFVIDYTPEEAIVGFTGHVASPAPFVVYENPAAKDIGKAPAAEVEAAPESSPFPSKRVTEEEAEAFMKIVKASEYKVVEQMAKSPAHISLLALLLGSEPHREALLQESVHYLSVTVHRTVMVDPLREPKPRVFELTHLLVIIDRLDRFDTRTSRSPIGDPYK